MHTIDPQSWKQDLPAFREKTDEFYAGTLDKGAYKGFSGLYGSYAQKGGKASMLRLRMTAGRVTRDKLAFVAQAIRTYSVPRAHFTTCQSIQLHDLLPEALYPIMEQALDHGIVTMGGGGDFPRNTMCSPLSGVEAGEYFDVLPYAQAAGDYAMNFIKAEKMPRKLKICFSNSPANLPHATYRDLGFAARPDGTFDVYSAGGLGNNPRFGVKVAEGVDPTRSSTISRPCGSPSGPTATMKTGARPAPAICRTSAADRRAMPGPIRSSWTPSSPPARIWTCASPPLP